MLKVNSTLIWFNLKKIFKNPIIITFLIIFILSVCIVIISASFIANKLDYITRSSSIRDIGFLVISFSTFILAISILVPLFLKQKEQGIISIEIRCGINYKYQFMIRFLVYLFIFWLIYPLFIVISLIAQFAILDLAHMEKSIINHFIWSITLFVFILPILLFPIITIVMLITPVILSTVINITVLVLIIAMPFLMAIEFKNNSNRYENMYNLSINFEMKESYDFYNSFSNQEIFKPIFNDTNELNESKFLTQVEYNLKGKKNSCGESIEEINYIPYKNSQVTNPCSEYQYLINALLGSTHININYFNEDDERKYALQDTEIFKIIDEWHQYILKNKETFQKLKDYDLEGYMDLNPFVDLMLKNEKFEVYEELFEWISDFNDRLFYYQRLKQNDDRFQPNIFESWKFIPVEIDPNNSNVNQKVVEENNTTKDFYSKVPQLSRINKLFILMVVNNAYGLQVFTTIYYSYEQYLSDIKKYATSRNANILNYFHSIYNGLLQKPENSDMLSSVTGLLNHPSTAYYKVDTRLIQDASQFKKTPLNSIFSQNGVIRKIQFSASSIVLIEFSLMVILSLSSLLVYKFYVLR